MEHYHNKSIEMIQIDLPIEMSRAISGDFNVDICKFRSFHSSQKIQIALTKIRCTQQESNSIHFKFTCNLKNEITSHIISHTSLHFRPQTNCRV